MLRRDIFDKLKDIVEMVLGENCPDLSTVTEESNLITDMGMSSIGMLYLVIAIEEKFDIRFDDVNFSDFATVGSVIDYIEGHVK